MRTKSFIGIALLLVGFLLVVYGFGAPSPTIPTYPIEPEVPTEEQPETLPQEEGTGEGGSTEEEDIIWVGVGPLKVPVPKSWFPDLEEDTEEETSETTSGGSTGDGGTPYVPPPGHPQPITTIPFSFSRNMGCLGIVLMLSGLFLFFVLR